MGEVSRVRDGGCVLPAIVGKYLCCPAAQTDGWAVREFLSCIFACVFMFAGV